MVSGSAAGDEERKRGDVADADEEGILKDKKEKCSRK